MTDKQIIETLNNIKAHCRGRECENCTFKTSDKEKYCCQITLIVKEMSTTPSQWDMEEIERLVKL